MKKKQNKELKITILPCMLQTQFQTFQECDKSSRGTKLFKQYKSGNAKWVPNHKEIK